MKSFVYNNFINKPPLTNFEILKLSKNLKYFKGVYMRDELNNYYLQEPLSIIFNLDSSENQGTHWVCFFINSKTCYYFDSFGLFPPVELTNFLKQSKNCDQLIGSSFQVQNFNTNYCGYLCLYVLEQLSNNFKFEDVIINLYQEFKK